MNRAIRKLCLIFACVLLTIQNASASSIFDSCPAEAPEIVAIRNQAVSLLNRNDYKGLDAIMSQLQQDYENGKRSDVNLLHVLRMSLNTDPALEEKFNGWVTAYPKSYIAYIMRGTYLRGRAGEARGTKFISDTTSEQIAAMQAFLKRAMMDLSQSEKLTQKPLLTYHGYLGVIMMEGDAAAARKMVDSADALDPKNFIVRYKYLVTLQTRWGGSLKKMQDFTEEARNAGLPQDQMTCFEQLTEEEQNWLNAPWSER